ncbi:DUF3515 family protein [Streptomyces sp. NPDC000229]|uniref:DUF3515 family protein n=1 Tax=Streptomyces sp. NPDC000229 TaxID=3154247 RepID=UPI00332DA0B3
MPGRRIGGPFTKARVTVMTTAAVGIGVVSILTVREMTSPTFGLEAAPRAHASECATIAKGYPEQMAGRERTRTDVPGAAVWGDGAVIVRCGLEPPAPTIDPCANIDGVDWVWREGHSDGGRKLIITYGRDPAVEATFSDGVSPDAVLVGLSRVVGPIRQDEKCLAPYEDVTAQ